MIELYKATLDFLKTPYIWIAIVISTGMMKYDDIAHLLSLCK